MEGNHPAKKCEHFSIRGYTAEMRKKEPGICWPFAPLNKLGGEITSSLPPMPVPEVGCWRDSNDVCVLERGNRTLVPQFGGKKYNEDEVRHKAFSGEDKSVENDENHEANHQGCYMMESNPSFSTGKGPAAAPDAFKSKGKGLVVSSEAISHEGSNIKRLERPGCGASIEGEKRIVSKARTGGDTNVQEATSSGFIRPQKRRKERRLSELLGTNLSGENGNPRTDGLYSASSHQGGLAVRRTSFKRPPGRKGKKKMLLNIERESEEIVPSSKLTENFNGDAEVTEPQRTAQLNPLLNGKRNMRTEPCAGIFPFVVPKGKRTNYGNAKMHYDAASGSFSRSPHGGYSNGGSMRRPGDSEPPKQAGKKSMLNKGKSKIGECSLPEREMGITDPKHEKVKLQSVPDTKARNGSNSSLDNECDYIAQKGYGCHLMKNLANVGESTFPFASSPDLLRRGLSFDLNEKMAQTSPPCEMHKIVTHVEEGSSSQHPMMDQYGTYNSENSFHTQQELEVAKLLAKNLSLDYTNAKAHSEKMGVSSTKSSGEENISMRIPRGTTGMMKKEKNVVGTTQENPVNVAPAINKGKSKGKSVLPGLSTFSKCDDGQSGGVEIAYSSVRNLNPTLNRERRKEEAERLYSSVMPNSKPPGLKTRRKYGTVPSKFVDVSKHQDTLLKDIIPMNFDLNLNPDDPEEQNKSSHSISPERISNQHAFVIKQEDCHLSTGTSNSPTLHSNETGLAKQHIGLKDGREMAEGVDIIEITEDEFCISNRNPAEINNPGAREKYMASGKDQQKKKKIPVIELE